MSPVAEAVRPHFASVVLLCAGDLVKERLRDVSRQAISASDNPRSRSYRFTPSSFQSKTGESVRDTAIANV